MLAHGAVMQQARDGLKKNERKQDEPDDRMVVRDLEGVSLGGVCIAAQSTHRIACVHCHPDAGAGADDNERQREELHACVDPDGVAAAQNTDQNRAEREQDHPCDAPQCGVCVYNIAVVVWGFLRGDG